MLEEFKKNCSRNLLGIIFAIAGIIVCIYSVAHHFAFKSSEGATDFACNINSTVSCDAVVASNYSEIFGIPLGAFGLGYFLCMLVLMLMSLIPNQKHEKWWIRTYSVMAMIGAFVSLFYGSIAWFIIGALCPSCLGIYTVCALQFILVLVYWKTIYFPKISFPVLRNIEEYKDWVFDVLKGGVISTAIVLCTIIAFLLFTPSNLTAPAGILKNVESIPSLDFSLKHYDIPIVKGRDMDRHNDFRKGNDEAKVVIVEFSDFQCPACMKAAEQITSLSNEFKDQVLVVFKNYPLDRNCNPNIKRKYHDYACEAAVMARCVGRTGKFWEYHDTLFSKRREINSDNLNIWALNLGLTQDQIDYCKLSKEYIDIVRRDLFMGDGLKITGSPTIFVNGRMFIGKNYSSLRNEVKRILDADVAGTADEYNPVDAIKKLIDTKRAVLVDVREPSEWAANHIVGSVSLPLSSLRRVTSDPSVVSKLPNDKVIYLYCQSGQRAELASQILDSLNYTVRPLAVQYEDLVNAGFEAKSELE